ncbi:hypothetical protein [Neobacillus sp. LXY-4]|uniref:hypothetical protein n=1 Tax=Neobacillus sp. LXY-4 TaxID=3379826 RepID=UPI003EDF328F
MASKNSVFGKILAVFLVLIIISGSGFLAYNLLSGSMGSMNMSGSDMNSDQSTSDQSKDKTTNKADTSEQKMNMEDNSSKDSMDMGQSSSKENMTMEDTTSGTNTQYSTPVLTAVLQNQDDLAKAMVTLKDSLSLLGQEVSEEETTNTDPNANHQQSQNQSNTTTDAQGNTVVNVYPQNGTMATAMENMGTTYDAAKMEQLHTGYYKVAIGMQLLEQLKSNLSGQLEMASASVTNPSQYYNNQFLTTVQNKNKLTEALTYINEAGSLVNINPYVSKDGLVYNKEKMGQLHDSINKLAIAVVDLNKINDNFSQQSIQFSNLAQNSPTMTSVDMDMDMGGSFLSNINMTTVFNVLVIVFIFIFVISMFGYVSRLLKAPKNS